MIAKEDAVKLVGLSYKFEDGNEIKVTQVKNREDGPWVTYEIKTGPGIPKRLVMPVYEFWGNYSHLFPNLSGDSK